MPGGSKGTVCMSGGIGRFIGPGQVGNTGDSGTLSLEIDPSVITGPAGPILPSFGERFYFQAWHRDVNPTLTSGFTDGVTVRIF